MFGFFVFTNPPPPPPPSPPPSSSYSWDAEILMSCGWVECVGIADRSAFDLKVHTAATKVELVAREYFPEPRNEEVVVVKVNRQLVGKTFKLDNLAVSGALEALVEDKAAALALRDALSAGASASFTAGEKTFTLTADMVKITVEERKVSERKYVPNVIEPSFGIGRILTGVWEHNFYVRDGAEQRCVLSFKPAIAPFKAVLLPLDARIPRDVVARLAASCTAAGFSVQVDDSSATIGKRYSRADELGVPFAVTVDFDSLKDSAVTLRERDTCAQVRLPMADLVGVLRALMDESLPWAGLPARGYTVVTTGEDKAAAAGAGAGAGAGGAAHAMPSAAAGAVAAVVAEAVVVPVVPSVTVRVAPGVMGTSSVGGSVGVRLEGAARTAGRFARPADMPIV